ncbi:transposase family protein [Burkholderia diffusa]|nr:transposase family protein [Burkholderia diffusa]
MVHGRRLRTLTVVDNYTRECPAIEVGQSLKGEHVVEALTRITAMRGHPATIEVDNGSEFIAKAMDRWAYEHGVELDFSRPGTPTDNAKVESFNGCFQRECPNTHWFLSLADTQSKIDDWRTYCNEVRPHSALQWMTPAEFARQARESASPDNSTRPEISTFDRDSFRVRVNTVKKLSNFLLYVESRQGQGESALHSSSAPTPLTTPVPKNGPFLFFHLLKECNKFVETVLEPAIDFLIVIIFRR